MRSNALASRAFQRGQHSWLVARRLFDLGIGVDRGAGDASKRGVGDSPLRIEALPGMLPTVQSDSGAVPVFLRILVSRGVVLTGGWAIRSSDEPDERRASSCAVDDFLASHPARLGRRDGSASRLTPKTIRIAMQHDGIKS